MSIVRVGTNKKYADNWESAFGKKSKSGKEAAKGSSDKKSSSKETAKKSSPKKAAGKKAKKK